MKLVYLQWCRRPARWLTPGMAAFQRLPDAAGSVVMASMEGTRPLLVEIQALVTPTRFGNPRRTAAGVELTVWL